MTELAHAVTTWTPIDLAGLPDRTPATPEIGGLVYPGRRHIFSGPPESAKTFAAFCLAADEIRNGHHVIHIDFEMFAYETRDRLRAMGLTDTEMGYFIHVEPETPANHDIIGNLVQTYEPRFTIIDAAAGAYALENLDDHKRQDAENFAYKFIEPFRSRDVATITLDHVTKSTQTRGAFAIGSERKIGGADVHLGFEPVVPLGRGRTGLVKIQVHKDRFGHLPRPRVADLEIRSDPLTHAVTWQFLAPEPAEAPWRPTALMEKVSRFLELQHTPVTRSVVEENVTGQGKYLRAAMDALVADGYALETAGKRGARLLSSSRPFLHELVSSSSHTNPHEHTDSASSSQLVSARLKGGTTHLVSSSLPLKGDGDEDEVVGPGRNGRPDHLFDDTPEAEVDDPW